MTPLIIAHRGASAHFPENTLLAFEAAIRAGAHGIELDVFKCASGEIVVSHDQELTRLTGQAGNVEALTLSQLQTRDFGSHKAKPFDGTKIPCLEEVFELTKDLPLLNIEIKSDSFISNGIERDLIELIKKWKRLEQVVVSSLCAGINRRIVCG